jgi:hypothetical protein
VGLLAFLIPGIAKRHPMLVQIGETGLALEVLLEMRGRSEWVSGTYV